MNSPMRGRDEDHGELLPLRFGPNEWLGALGDLGTLLPLFLSLVAVCGLPASRSLIMIGCVYLGGAFFFRVPMPVQPFKAMAAIVIAQHMGLDRLWAGGLMMGLILLALAFSGGLSRLEKYFTPAVVKGIQFGVGLLLVKASLELLSAPARGFFTHTPLERSWPIYLSALWTLVIPQLPMTLGNSVYASVDAAKVYFGDKARRVTPRNLAISLGIANLGMGLCGGLPVCHGSGGLTAHYRLGARTAGATVILGIFFIVLAAASQGAPDQILSKIPSAILAALVLYVGVCHIQLIRGLTDKRAIALVMGLIGLWSQNLTYALLAGILFERLMVGRMETVTHTSALRSAKARTPFEPAISRR